MSRSALPARLVLVSHLFRVLLHSIADGIGNTRRWKGDEQPECEVGDLIVVLHELEHERFRRRGADLFMKLEIGLAEVGWKEQVIMDTFGICALGRLLAVSGAVSNIWTGGGFS